MIRNRIRPHQHLTVSTWAIITTAVRLRRQRSEVSLIRTRPLHLPQRTLRSESWKWVAHCVWLFLLLNNGYARLFFSPHRPNIRSVNANQWTKWSMKTFSWPCLYIEVYIRDIHIYIIYIFCFYIVQSDHVTVNRLCATFCTSRTFHEGMASCHAHLYCLFRHRVIVTVHEVSSQIWKLIISKCEFFDGFYEREFQCAKYVSIGTRFFIASRPVY